MMSAPESKKIKGLLSDPILPAAVRMREWEAITGVVKVVKIEPADAVREREVVEGKVMGEEIVISPVVWAREREVVLTVKGEK